MRRSQNFGHFLGKKLDKINQESNGGGWMGLKFE